jgi:hypothetical protein
VQLTLHLHVVPKLVQGAKCQLHSPIHLPDMLPDLAQDVNTCAARLISKSLQALGVGNISPPRLMSKAESLLEVEGTQISVFLQSERCTHQCSSVWVGAAIT